MQEYITYCKFYTDGTSFRRRKILAEAERRSRDEKAEKKYISENGGYIGFRFALCERGIWRGGTDNC